MQRPDSAFEVQRVSMHISRPTLLGIRLNAEGALAIVAALLLVPMVLVFCRL